MIELRLTATTEVWEGLDGLDRTTWGLLLKQYAAYRRKTSPALSEYNKRWREANKDKVKANSARWEFNNRRYHSRAARGRRSRLNAADESWRAHVRATTQACDPSDKKGRL